ncbi:PREDICTED: uncharacterized protein LOC107343465 [Acropora digitifera]|uniref:uncharacterized protein LOC107343465 n=1 Tax=Acropora digitifera TaxID=70779 RepID=UPI00077B0810|nr:PREDICTED: uncharacterized protein LOC107343465 [Acropora digitifera]
MFWLSLSLVAFWCQTTKGKISWPPGQYALPMPKAGCPDNWFEGRRFHDTSGTLLIDQNIYESLHLAGWISKEGIEQDFCIKTTPVKDSSHGWPEGKYCILKQEYCPSGFSTGSVSWRPSPSPFQDLSVNGKYLKNTTISYCCRMRGDTKQAILLPLDKPFYLYTLRGTSCQNVRGATVKEESVSLENTHGKYEIDMKGVNPFITDGNNSPAKITYCYYTPGGSIAIPESQEVEKTLFTESQLDNRTQSSGLAVAIGVGIACAMIGTASIAVVTKRFMIKRASNEGHDEDDDNDDEPRPDDP